MKLPRAGQVVLGSFRLQHLLGAGSFATAFVAEQIGTERRAVVKFPHTHLLTGAQGGEIRRRFQVEARAATRVSHPNLVTVYTVGETAQGLPALAMEYVDGVSLAEYLGQFAPIPLIQLAALGTQIGEALSALHSADIVHRDLSPSNVMVVREPGGLKIKVLDFGVAMLLDAPARTSFGPVGTPGYIAPEQIMGRVTPRSDVYSLGAILWWALTGQERPDDYHNGEFIQSMGEREGPDPLTVRPDAPTNLARIVSQALVPEESSRSTVEGFLSGWRSAFDASAIPQYRPSNANPSARMTLEIARPVALVVGNSVVRSMVTDRLRADRVELQTVEPRELMRANPGTYRAAIFEADHPSADSPALLRTMTELYPGLPCVVVGGAEHSAFPWEQLGAHGFIELPGELEVLRRFLADELGLHTVSSVPSSVREELDDSETLGAAVSDLVGGLPHWLASLERGLEVRDARESAVCCRQILGAAERLGLVRLAQLARAGCAFVADGDFESARAFVQPIRAHYTEIFPELFQLLDRAPREVRA